MQNSTANKPIALVVEDDEHIAHLLRFLLQRENYDVRHEKDGRAGLAFIQNSPPPALALLDVMLPFVDGFELVTALRGRPEWAQVPVIMLTAKAQERDIVRALDAGANDYVLKPFKPDELLARIRRHRRAGA